MRTPIRAIAALPFLLAAPAMAQIVGAGSAALGGGVSTRSITRAATVGAGTAAATSGTRSSTVPSVGLSAGGDTGASGTLGRPPQALGTTPTLSERIDGAAGVPSPRIGERVGSNGFSVAASDSNRMQEEQISGSARLDSAGRPTGTPFGPDPVHKTVPGALDHDDDPLTPQ